LTVYNVWANPVDSKLVPQFRHVPHRMASGWRMLFFLLIGICLILVITTLLASEEASTPCADPNLTPTITQTLPSLTPTITITLYHKHTSVSDTYHHLTPHIPLVIEIHLPVLLPNPDAPPNPICSGLR
jgi:hypothetical protein